MADRKFDVIGQPGVPKASPGSAEVRRSAERRAAIQEGLDEIHRGETIPAEDIEAWIESWDTPSELPPPEPRRR